MKLHITRILKNRWQNKPRSVLLGIIMCHFILLNLLWRKICCAFFRRWINIRFCVFFSIPCVHVHLSLTAYHWLCHTPLVVLLINNKAWSIFFMLRVRFDFEFVRESKFLLSFSNSLIIHQVKAKKITSVKEVWIPGLISVDFHDFTSPFIP